MSKLWSGRFSKETDELVEAFTASIEFDQKLVFYDIVGSKAHANMLARQGIIPEEDVRKIQDGLDQIWQEAVQGELDYQITNEDIHMNIEHRLIEITGEVGKKLHTARSRNDQVAVDMHMFMCDQAVAMIGGLSQLLESIWELAQNHVETYMPGYTHMQRAQPTTFSHHMLNYFWKFHRDITRLFDFRNRVDEMPLGSGAFAGTGFNISRAMVAEELGFNKVFENSMDAVSSRDSSMELLFCINSIMMNLSRLSEELVLWSSKEFDFIELDDAFATGSSIMPQKKNPDVPELIRGKTGRVMGHLTALTNTCKALPMAYNKDFQEDKEGLFDALDTVHKSVEITAKMLPTMTVKTDKMKQALYNDFANATDIADYLAEKGMPFRDAHAVVGNLVKTCQDNDKVLTELTGKELEQLIDQVSDSLEQTSLKVLQEAETEEILQVLDPINCVKNRVSFGGPAPETLIYQVRHAEQVVQDLKAQLAGFHRFLPEN